MRALTSHMGLMPMGLEADGLTTCLSSMWFLCYVLKQQENPSLGTIP